MMGAKDLAHILGLSPDRVSHLADYGIIPKPKKIGQYKFYDCVKAYVQYIKDSQKDIRVETGDGRLMTKAEIQGEQALIALQEKQYDIEERQKSIVRVDLVVSRWKMRMVEIMNRMIRLGDDVVDVCFQEDTKRVAKQRVKKLIKEALRGIRTPLEENEKKIKDIDEDKE